jgi:hypothetical protein
MPPLSDSKPWSENPTLMKLAKGAASNYLLG